MNKHPEIAVLSRHLQTNVQALRGKVFGASQRFSPALLLPLAALAGATVLLTLSPKARKSLLLKVAMLVSTHLLQDQDEKLEREMGYKRGGDRYDPSEE